MKKVIVAAALFFAALSAYSQDLITTRAGEDIQARVLEVGTKEVHYRKASNPEGPVFVIPVADILMIRYENGDKNVFSGKEAELQATGEVVPGMKYKEYKDLYTASMYRPAPGDPYSRGWAGVASLFIPGLGQGIDGEWLRGLAFFGGSLACNVLAWSTADYVTSNGYTQVQFTGMSLIATLASLGINIWSIVDAVHVAKIKNMYDQDIRSRRAMADFKVEPFVAATPVGLTQARPVAGLAMRVTF